MLITRPPLVRLMVIDREIRCGRHPSAPKLAEILEVSPRTVARDLEYLRDSLCAPLEWSAAEGGYRYSEPGFALPGQRLTEGEFLAVLVADKALCEYRGTRFEGMLRTIFEKLPSALPEEISVSPRELAEASSFEAIASGRIESRTVRLLQDAIHEKETLSVRYHMQSRGESGLRRIDPYHLANVDGEWYLLAFCHRRGEVRVFRLSRMRNCKPTGDHFRVQADFMPAAFLRTRFHAMAGDAPVEIRVRFDRSVADGIQERDLGSAQRLQYLTDGGVELTMTTESADAVIRWVLNWGAGAEILSPPWVRQRVRDLLRRLQEQYSGASRSRSIPRRLARARKKVFKPPSLRDGH